MHHCRECPKNIYVRKHSDFLVTGVHLGEHNAAIVMGIEERSTQRQKTAMAQSLFLFHFYTSLLPPSGIVFHCSACQCCTKINY